MFDLPSIYTIWVILKCSDSILIEFLKIITFGNYLNWVLMNLWDSFLLDILFSESMAAEDVYWDVSKFLIKQQFHGMNEFRL